MQLIEGATNEVTIKETPIKGTTIKGTTIKGTTLGVRLVQTSAFISARNYVCFAVDNFQYPGQLHQTQLLHFLIFPTKIRALF